MNENEEFFENLHKDVHSAHRKTDGGGRPPSNMWNAIRAQVKQETKQEEKPMISTAAHTATHAPFTGTSHKGFGHYLNLAVTIALVLAVAVAGWFAIGQLNQPGEPEPRLAIVGSTPGAEATPESGSATCDVDPLSTDTVMEIVKNPARFTANGPTGEPTDRPMVGSPTNAEFWEVDPDLELVGESTTPSEEQFDDASEFANVYLECLISGTQGQIWTFYSPVLLQQKILGEFPVFAEESQVRDRVEELAAQPAYQAEYAWQVELTTGPQPLNPDDQQELEFDPDIATLNVNPDFEVSRMHQSESSYYEYVISAGIVIDDPEGNQIRLTNGQGRDMVPSDPMMEKPPIYIQVAKLRSSDGWVIIPWPSESEMGWNLYWSLSG